MFELSADDILKYWIFFMVILTVHQYGHIKAAGYFGDFRYERSGRDSVNPFRHISLVSMFTGMFFGIMWPKKIEFESKGKSEIVRRNQRIVFEISGSIANLVCGFAILAAVSLLLWVARKSMDPSIVHFLSVDMKDLAWMNIYLVLVNLLPIKGFDGYIWVRMFFDKLQLNDKIHKAYDIGTYSVLAGFLLSGLSGYNLYFYDLFLKLRQYVP